MKYNCMGMTMNLDFKSADIVYKNAKEIPMMGFINAAGSRYLFWREPRTVSAHCNYGMYKVNEEIEARIRCGLIESFTDLVNFGSRARTNEVISLRVTDVYQGIVMSMTATYVDDYDVESSPVFDGMDFGITDRHVAQRDCLLKFPNAVSYKATSAGVPHTDSWTPVYEEEEDAEETLLSDDSMDLAE